VPYLSGEGETLQDAKLWCEGFFYGMALHGAEWMEHESEHLATLTAPILYIADPGDLSKELGKKQRQRLDRQQKQLVEAIRYNVPQVYDFWNVTKKADFKKDLYPTQEPPAS
jgi:yecA family protein